MASETENSAGIKTPLPSGSLGGSDNANLRNASESVASNWRNTPTLAGAPRKGPQGRKPGGAVAPRQPTAAPGAIDSAAPGASAGAPIVDRPLIESLFESIFRGLDDHFTAKLKSAGRDLVKHNFASEADVLELVSLSKIKDVELIPAKQAFGAVCEKHGWLGQYVPEAILIVLVGKMGTGWFMAQRRLHEIKVEIQATIKKQQGGHDGKPA